MYDNDDHRKSNAMAEQRVTIPDGARLIQDFSVARDVLRSASSRQAGAGAELIDAENLDMASMFYLDGEPHRNKRATVARYFSLKAIETRYTPVIALTTDRLLNKLKQDGRADLDLASFRLAVAVTSEVLGLDWSDLDGLAARIEATLANGDAAVPLLQMTDTAVETFFAADVLPAIEGRRISPKEDVISRLIEQGWSDNAILTEVMAYAVGGMLTTREFIVMAAWHLFGSPDLRHRYGNSDKQGQLAILGEILRLEPVAAVITRRMAEDMETRNGETIPAGTLVAIDIRGANYDSAITGGCPFAIDPDRAGSATATVGFMSFGDGPHRCPGAQLALHEAQLFLDRLFKIPTLALLAEPNITWYDPIHSYELRGAVVTV